MSVENIVSKSGINEGGKHMAIRKKLITTQRLLSQSLKDFYAKMNFPAMLMVKVCHMREIVADWGVDRPHFKKFYNTMLNALGEGVVLNKDSIQIDNPLAKGNVDFFPFSNGIALVRISLFFTEAVNFKRLLEAGPEYYACLFSLKEGVDMHVFDDADDHEMHGMGLSAKHSVLYFSSDVQSLFRVTPDEETKIVILVFTSGALHNIFPFSANSESSGFRVGHSLKGYSSKNADMVEKVTDIFDHVSVEHIQSLYLQGAVYQLLAVLFLKMEEDRKLLMQSTGVIEVARMIQIRNLLIADFSSDCPLLEEMAKKAQMSPTKFKTLFKKLFNLPYYQYYQRYRLHGARHAIILGKSIGETAYEFSFNSISNFSVAFKKMFKISPSQLERPTG
ncbi:helix-turn-helix domain-containing protein [Pinibacter soli]|uniref:AraC family transcriptional regulator n=1 Tax=Pinibacter soli TaxID=3044211 RepID=A0ABT6RFP2_9BACT|nr:AraC family transcriptional regulator [Pinibacter soli]MDI3321383.1 AraC family transcriptional regulator [Pinibacter soli]